MLIIPCDKLQFITFKTVSERLFDQCLIHKMPIFSHYTAKSEINTEILIHEYDEKRFIAA